MTSRSEVHHANHYTIEASYKKGQIFYVEVYNVLLFCEVKIKMHVTYNEWILEFACIIINLWCKLQTWYIKINVIIFFLASLFYTSVKEDKNCDLLYKYLVHRIFGFPFKTPALVVEKDAVFMWV